MPIIIEVNKMPFVLKIYVPVKLFLSNTDSKTIIPAMDTLLGH